MMQKQQVQYCVLVQDWSGIPICARVRVGVANVTRFLWRFQPPRGGKDFGQEVDNPIIVQPCMYFQFLFIVVTSAYVAVIA